jgi:hypothetical protein
MIMQRLTVTALVLSMLAFPCRAEDPDDAGDTGKSEKTSEKNGDGIESPKTMSGMSILGNEEAPKSLVIVPWKSSELGNEITIHDTLDERARPVDKDVFMRELEYYNIKSGDQVL